jgi:hypothetical protein
VDEMLLYQFNQKNTEANGVFDKLNKFWFLFETHLTELEKLVQEKQEAESKKKQLHEIFRNF